MSRIEQLIEELCPDGVEWKTLGDCFEMRNGYTPSKSKREYWENGTIPWFRMEDIRANGRILSKSIQQISKQAVKGGKLFPSNSIIIATSATIGEHALITTEFLSNQRFTCFYPKNVYKEKIYMKYMYYYSYFISDWCKSNTNVSGFASVDMSKLKKLLIPIPPLPIQQEIVNILDKFTALDASLQAELEARKKQFEHYRNQLLSFEGKEVEWKTLGGAGGIAEIGTGTRNTVDAIENGEYPFYVRSANILLIDHYEFDEEAILTSGDGVGVGKILHYVNGKYGLHQRAYRFRMKHHDISTKFVFFYMKNTFEKFILGSAVNSSVTSVRRPMLEKYKIPIPPLAEQERIVSILDKFETLVNEELPAEIAARRKQYEYYREKLLTFEPLVS